MPELAYVNGVTTTLVEGKVPVIDGGFRQGYGVFETMRGYGGRLFRLGAHLDRLRSGAVFLGIPLDPGEVGKTTTRLLVKSGLSQARIRIVVTGGPAGKPSTVITVENFQPPSEDDYRSGLAAITASVRRRSDSPVYGYKTLNQIENSLAKAEAESRDAAEAIFLNEHGEVAETNRANIFIIKGGVLKTPGLDSGILPGITRAAALERARGLDITTVEGNLGFDDLHNADEVFITSSLVEIMPLTRINDTPLGDGNIGPVTARLLRVYREIVVTETGFVAP
jgi:branched-subunit amino acid aminotransferase/4-amino-4-deoxychorismate lyase